MAESAVANYSRTANSYLNSAYDTFISKNAAEVENLINEQQTAGYGSSNVVPKPPPGIPQRSNNIYPTR